MYKNILTCVKKLARKVFVKVKTLFLFGTAIHQIEFTQFHFAGWKGGVRVGAIISSWALTLHVKCANGFLFHFIGGHVRLRLIVLCCSSISLGTIPFRTPSITSTIPTTTTGGSSSRRAVSSGSRIIATLTTNWAHIVILIVASSWFTSSISLKALDRRMSACIHVVIFSIINVFVICILCPSSFALIQNRNILIVVL